MIEVAEGPPSSNASSEERAVRDMAESETDCSEGLDEAVLGRLASLPLDPFPPRDFRGKFKKMRHKKRPTILECRYRAQLWRSGGFLLHTYVYVYIHARKGLFI